jgi:hypothetical protein
MRKDKLINIIKIAKYLEENPNSYLREIARNLNISPGSVHRALKEMEDFIETSSINQQFSTNLPNLPVFIRLKEGITADGLARYFARKEKLKKIVKE